MHSESMSNFKLSFKELHMAYVNLFYSNHFDVDYLLIVLYRTNIIRQPIVPEDTIEINR